LSGVAVITSVVPTPMPITPTAVSTVAIVARDFAESRSEAPLDVHTLLALHWSLVPSYFDFAASPITRPPTSASAPPAATP
jgi:hypothetical protein